MCWELLRYVIPWLEPLFAMIVTNQIALLQMLIIVSLHPICKLC